ncbi:hypothetical protein PHYPSEUDO_000240 [Phytophthora pseudosyringae]|uniref:Uncharacterized protein n=1 Tax=Phytophthora pseudosyringae TaxID=221518 RepID=A0A8T1WEI0_9STRA|nr:hypothetical protein PHYPSEUDO_000240 [Phytophthora pseudosyringae]
MTPQALPLPLHPRRAQQLFQEVLLTDSELTPQLLEKSLPQRLLELQRLNLGGIQEAKRGTRFQRVRVATDSNPHAEAEAEEVTLTLTKDGSTLQVATETADLTASLRLIDITGIVLHMAPLHSFSLQLDGGNNDEAGAAVFVASSADALHRWIVALTCGVNAFQQQESSPLNFSDAKQADLVWQAVRLRVFELAQVLGMATAIDHVTGTIPRQDFEQAAQRSMSGGCGGAGGGTGSEPDDDGYTLMGILSSSVFANMDAGDTESSATGGTKRKLKENAFTAKAESGTLKVKILRRDQRAAASAVDTPSSSTSSATTKKKTKTRRASRQAPPPPDSPPKPRPNRKHVPIFYEPQFRQPIKRGGSSHSHGSSTDEHSTSSTGVPGIHSTSSTEVSGAAASTSSTGSGFVSQLSDVRLQSASTSDGDLGPPPRANPLFARNDSGGLGSIGELLRPFMPSGSAGLQPSFPLGGAQLTGTTSSAGLLVDQTAGLSSALHQLASSSASYRSALDALSTANGKAMTAADATTSSASASASSAATATSSTSLGTTHSGATGGLENYRFDPFAALQTAIDHARRVSNASANQNNDKHREIGSPDSSARFYRLEPSGFSEPTKNNGHTSTASSLGPAPELPPAFTLQNSLVGGGIQRFTPPRPSVEESSNKEPTSSSSSKDNGAKEAIAALGAPPDAPPSFLLSNSLTGGGISILNLPKANPSLDRLGSLTRLISQANEHAKDLNDSLTSPPKTHLRLHRLVSSVSATSEDGETVKGPNLTASHSAASAPNMTSSTTHKPKDINSEAADLGPPPSGPPAFTIGNSLMGGGIELQPAAANVNTHNFDWKLHKSTSSSGGEVSSNPAGSRGLSHGLRARLERSLASSQSDTDKS